MPRAQMPGRKIHRAARRGRVFGNYFVLCRCEEFVAIDEIRALAEQKFTRHLEEVANREAET